MEYMNQEDSYADRRRLFKSIWETAMNIDEKDPDIMKKPKIIKTLRLDEVDRCVIGKTKKQRIKDLRTVCNKILDFCDKQDADDVFYEHLANQAQQRDLQLYKVDSQPKKVKRTKRKIKKAQSLLVPNTETNPKQSKQSKGSTSISPERSKKKTIKRGSANNNTLLKPQPSPASVEANSSGMSGDTQKRRKVFTKKIVKRKKLQPNVHLPTGKLRHRPLTRLGYSPLSTTIQKMTEIKEIVN